MPGLLIIAESAGGQLAPTTLELAAEGRKLADQLNQPLTALLAGSNVSGGASSLCEHGVDLVLLADDGGATPTSPQWLLAAAQDAAKRVAPEIILLTHSTAGRELGPALAYRLDTGIVTDCTALRLEDSRLVMTKPVYGGSAISEQVIVNSPQMATLRPRAFEAGPPQAGRQAQVEQLSLLSPDSRVQVLEEVRETAVEGPRLKDARIVVSGGRGLGGPENWHYVEEIAQVLGAAVGATRAVTDAGWVPPTLQVGLTGATIAPDLYITVGISGAVQHIAGISGARNVVAINRDRDANIFKYARFGVAGDWKQVVPAFIQRLKELRG
jgi:electron transfer flavoprotein alpha subunit